MFEDGFLGRSVNTETLVGGGDFEWSDGLYVSGVKGSVQPCDVGILQPEQGQQRPLTSCSTQNGILYPKKRIPSVAK